MGLDVFKEIPVEERLPEKPGKYLVKTESFSLADMYGFSRRNIKMFQASFTGKRFDVTNQTVISWYERSEVDGT